MILNSYVISLASRSVNRALRIILKNIYPADNCSYLRVYLAFCEFFTPFSMPRGVFRHMDFRTLYCPASLHAEGFQHLVHAFNILYDAVLAADSEADIKRVDEGELRHARRHEKLLGRIQLKADVADLFERRIRVAGDADGRCASVSETAWMPMRMRRM